MHLSILFAKSLRTRRRDQDLREGGEETLRWKDVIRSGERAVCVLDRRGTGGAVDFALRRVESLAAEGRAVLHLVYHRRERRIRLTARRGGLSAEAWARGLEFLLDASCPRFEELEINELYNWSVAFPRSLFAPRNGGGRSAFIGGLLGQIVRIKHVHRARLRFFVHDFYPLCPGPHLMNLEGRYCGLPDMTTCASCLPTRRHNRGVSLPRWRAAWQAFFDHTEQMVFFSASSLELMRRAFFLPDERVELRPHDPLPRYQPMPETPAGAPLCVAVVGNITQAKGARIVWELVDLLAAERPEARLVVIGELEGAAHRTGLPAQLTVTGPYRKEDLPSLLAAHGCTVGLMASVWPETFSFVTQELMQLNLPLVCFPLGAPFERIRAWERGLPATAVSARAALDALVELDARRAVGRS